MAVEGVIVAFMVLELLNVSALYFAPGSKYANAVGVFTAWEQSKGDPALHAFVQYLVNWVAGVKLIFLALLGLIVLFGDAELQRLSLLALAATTATFYWRLFPLARGMARRGEVEPGNYATVLGVMILGFLVAFVAAAIF